MIYIHCQLVLMLGGFMFFSGLKFRHGLHKGAMLLFSKALPNLFSILQRVRIFYSLYLHLSNTEHAFLLSGWVGNELPHEHSHLSWQGCVMHIVANAHNILAGSSGCVYLQWKSERALRQSLWIWETCDHVRASLCSTHIKPRKDPYINQPYTSTSTSFFL